MEELKETLPLLSREDFNRLRESIKDKGIQESIKILPDGTIIDGYHRKRIIQELDIERIPYEVKKISRDEAFELGISLNLARRHLSFDQKKEIIGKLRRRGWSQERVAKVVGIEQSRVSQLENGSIININITAIPDLRYKISKEEENKIFERAKTETQEQIASDYNITKQRVGQIIEKKEEETRVKKEAKKKAQFNK